MAYRISKFSNGNLTVLAGNGYIGYSGDNGPGIEAALDEPTGIALDANGYLYICDTDNSLIRKISPDGIITTIAGTTIGGIPPRAITATAASQPSALLSFPTGIVVDESGNVYFSDTDNNIVRELQPLDACDRQWWGGQCSAASPRKFSPGALATVFGSNFTGTGLDAIASLPLPSSLGGVSVQVNGVAAPVLYDKLESDQLPDTVGNQDGIGDRGRQHRWHRGQSTVNITVQAAAPDLFVQGSHAIVQNFRISVSTSSSNPAKAGGTIIAYLTGAGAVSNQPADGAAAGSGPVFPK